MIKFFQMILVEEPDRTRVFFPVGFHLFFEITPIPDLDQELC